MDNNKLIEKFYTSFSKGNAKGMIECYHENITFKDPAFGELKGEKAKKMWEMLLSKKNSNTQINFDNIKATEEKGSANWTAKYVYGDKNRKVTNIITAKFKFKDGKIIEHIDAFNLWKWTQQALGISGYLLGWTSFMKEKIQKTTNKKLANYMNKK